MEELIKLLPDSAIAISIIIVVVIFLRHMQKISDDCHATITGGQEKYQEQLQKVVDGYVHMSEKNIASINRLDTSIQMLHTRVSGGS